MTTPSPEQPPWELEPRGHARSILAVAAAIGLAAYNSGNNVFYLVASSLVAMVILAKLRGATTMRRLALRAYGGRDGLFARRPGELAIVARSREPVSVFLSGPPLAAPVTALASLRGRPVRITLTPMRRGWERLPALAVTSPGPYGITRHRRRLGLETPVLVFPEPARSFDLSALLDRRHRITEAPSASFPGEGTDFLMLRDYRPEDGVRRVYWKGLARTGQLLSRIHERPRQHALQLVLSPIIPADTPEWRERFEAALSRLTAAVLQAEERALPYAFSAPGISVPASLGPKHRLRVLGHLGTAVPSIGGPPPRPAARHHLVFAATDD